MITIAVIEKNRCSFDNIENFIPKLLYRELTSQEKIQLRISLDDYIWNIISPFIKLINVNIDDVLDIVCQQISQSYPDKQPDKLYYHTESSYVFPKKFVEIIFAQDCENSVQVSNMNNIACWFSLKHTVIENNAIVLINRFELSSTTKKITLDSVDKKDIIKVVRRRYFHSAIVIDQDQMTKYYFQDPLFLAAKVFKLTEKDYVQKIPVSFLGYNLVFYFQNNKTEFINQIATRINGIHCMYGRVIMIHEIEENIHANLSIREAKRLNVLAYGRLYDRQPKDEEKIEYHDQVPLWNGYLIVENRMKTFVKNQCINCRTVSNKPILCQKCFRVKFCSTKCQNEFRIYHDMECIKY